MPTVCQALSGYLVSTSKQSGQTNPCSCKVYVLKVYFVAQAPVPSSNTEKNFEMGWKSCSSRLYALKELRWEFYMKTSNDVSTMYLISLPPSPFTSLQTHIPSVD